MYEALLKQLNIEEADKDRYARALGILGAPDNTASPNNNNNDDDDDDDDPNIAACLKEASDAKNPLATAFLWLAENDHLENYNHLQTQLLSQHNQKLYEQFHKQYQAYRNLFKKLEISAFNDKVLYYELLRNLGTDAQALKDSEHFERLKDILDSLALLKKTLPNSSAHTFIYHAQALCELARPELPLDEILISERNRRLNELSNLAGTAATYTYMIMTALSAVELGVGIPFFTFLLQLWNYIDVGASAADTQQQYEQGEIAMARANLVGGGQMALATGVVSVAEISQLAGQALLPMISAAACSLLLGISFAISYGFCWQIEKHKVRLSNKIIDTLEKTLEPTSEKGLSAENRATLERHLLIAKARREDQENSATAFKICFVAMVVAVVAAYVCLSFLSCGGLPLATLLVAGAIFATSGVRMHLTQGESHSDLAQKSLAPPNTSVAAPVASTGSWLCSLFTTPKQPQNDDTHVLLPQDADAIPQESLHKRWMTYLHEYEKDPSTRRINLDQLIAIPASGLSRFFCKSTINIPLKKYLYDLQFKNPAKLDKLLQGLSQTNETVFQMALTESLGQKIVEQLTLTERARSPDINSTNEILNPINPTLVT